MAFLNLGYIFHEQGDYCPALEMLGQSLLIGHKTGDQQVESWGLARLGILYMDMGDYNRAITHFEQSLLLCRTTGDRSNESEVLASLTLLNCQLGQAETALECGQQALVIAQELDYLPLLADSQICLGQVLTLLGCLDPAVAAYTQALALRRALDQSHLTVEPLAGLACLALAIGSLTLAQTHLEEILPHLVTTPLHGIKEPGKIYLACYHVLHTCHDPRARGVLQAALQFLEDRAAKIPGNMRRSFFENISFHREILKCTQD